MHVWVSTATVGRSGPPPLIARSQMMGCVPLEPFWKGGVVGPTRGMSRMSRPTLCPGSNPPERRVAAEEFLEASSIWR